MNVNKEIGCLITNLFSKAIYFIADKAGRFLKYLSILVDSKRIHCEAQNSGASRFDSIYFFSIVNCYLQFKKRTFITKGIFVWQSISVSSTITGSFCFQTLRSFAVNREQVKSKKFGSVLNA